MNLIGKLVRNIRVKNFYKPVSKLYLKKDKYKSYLKESLNFIMVFKKMTVLLPFS